MALPKQLGLDVTPTFFQSGIQYKSKTQEQIAQVENFAAKLKGKKLFLASDYDGTLSPFVKNPSEAFPAQNTKEALLNLRKVCISAPITTSSSTSVSTIGRPFLITGRDIETVRKLFGEGHEGFDVIGDHGLAQSINCGEKTFVSCVSKETVKCLCDMKEEAKAFVSKLRSDYKLSESVTLFEEKTASFNFHWRTLTEDNYPNKEQIIDDMQKFLKTKEDIIKTKGLKVLNGNMTVEIMPDAISKGNSLKPILVTLDKDTLPVFLGDDYTGTDGSAAAVVRDAGGVTVQVLHDKPKHNLADYAVKSPADLGDFLADLNACLIRDRKLASQCVDGNNSVPTKTL
jgi:trehalose-phosphatase